MNTNKTYVAFDSTGVKDHVNSNLSSFMQLREWERQNPERFHFLNMEEIAFSSEHDDLVDSTLKNRFLHLMESADNLLVLSSSLMDVESPMLNWQISRAVNRFRLPVIVAYVGLDRVSDNTIKEQWDNLPNKIRKYIGRDSANMAHIPLTKDKLERALGYFSARKELYSWNSTTIF
ncbi:MAG: hypothetical protein J6W52_09560 [Bacteroidaceae bacterium]|nr:hypothetical protein [Bacteroidaceae bacterium]